MNKINIANDNKIIRITSYHETIDVKRRLKTNNEKTILI